MTIYSEFSSFYNLLKNCRGHSGEQSVFSDRTEESSAVQYFQVHTQNLPCIAIIYLFQPLLVQ